jgi:zinc D-Ala-D-Ala carboxypeptidase
VQLTKNFTLAEFLKSEKADALGIKNTPSAPHLSNLRMTALGMEMVRRALGGVPITITSGYRCEAVNRAVGGVSTSDHALGYAADFIAAKHTALEAATFLATSDIAFDQLIYEPSRGIVHISFNPRMRGQVMTQTGGPGTPFVPGVKDV